MKWIDNYIIPFYGLSEGIHDYDFEADNRFFEYFDNPDINGGNVSVKLKLNRKSNFFELDFNIKGHLIVVCDRCLENFSFEIETNQKLFIRFGEEEDEQSDNVVVLTREETRLNIAQYIYEFSALSIPVQRIHPDDESGNSGCNIEMLNKLEELQTKEVETIDPRWEALMKLKNNN